MRPEVARMGNSLTGSAKPRAQIAGSALYPAGPKMSSLFF